MKRLAICVAAAALVAGCASNTGQSTEPTGAAAVDPNNPLFAPGYMAMAASSDQFEIQSGQLALQMSQNPSIRAFAQQLITDHTRTTQLLMAAAQQAGLTPPPPMLLPEDQALLDQIRSAPAGSFDVAFRDVQATAHQKALALHQNYAASGDVPALRTVAAGAVPVIQGHLSHAQTLSVASTPAPMPMPAATAQPGERG
jgi:putative membrane protein